MRWLRELFTREHGAPAAAARESVDDAQIDEWMRHAYALHRDGRPDEAEDHYRRILRERPDNVDALYLLGEIANRSGRHELAVELIGRAIAGNEGVAIFHHEFGSALQSLRRHGEAQRSFERALALEPDNLEHLNNLGTLHLETGDYLAAEHCFRRVLERADVLAAHVNLAAALLRQNRLDEAEASSRKALAMDPLCSQAMTNLAGVAIKRKALDEAERLLDRALAIDPLSFEALVNLATVYLKQQRWDDALRILEDTVRARPGRPEVHHNLGKVYWHRGMREASARALRDTLELDPSRSEAYVELGRVLNELGENEEALGTLRSAVALDPQFAPAHASLGFVLETLGRYAEAMESYDRALALDPENVQAHVNRAVLRIRLGDYAGGWDEYEWRLRTEELVSFYTRFPAPRWDGSSLEGRTLLIYSEQGLGDEIMYSSCYPEVIACAGRCVIECDPRLATLFARAFPAALVRPGRMEDPDEWEKDGPAIDVKVPAASLPMYFRRSAEAFPRNAFLKADDERVAAWRERLAALGPGLKVGLSWRGGVPETGRTLRSLGPEQLAPIVRVPGVVFVSLQYGDSDAELAVLERAAGAKVHQWPAALSDYEETAALMCALDLSITVCTAVVHLGGALGRPVWVMAPVRPEARYGLEGPTMPWYASVRMFRQPGYRDWNSVLSSVASELAGLASRPTLKPSSP